MSKRAQFWIGILVSLLCIAVMLWVVDLEQALQALKTADWRVVLVIAAGQVAFMLLRAWRWRMLLGGVRYWPLFHAQNIGYLITNLLPFRLGDLARSLLVGMEPGTSGIGVPQALSSVVLERVLDMLVIIVFFGIAAPLAPALPEGMGSAGAFISVAAVVGFLVMLLAAANRPRALQLARWALERVRRPGTDTWPRLSQSQKTHHGDTDPGTDRHTCPGGQCQGDKWDTEFSQSFLRFSPCLRGKKTDSGKALETWLGRIESFLDGFNVLTRWRALLPTLGLSLLLWLPIVTGYYWGLRGFWPQATLPAALFTLSAAGFGVAVPSSPGSLGVFHGAVVLGLSVFPVAAEQALGFAIVYHVTMYFIILALGVMALWRSGQSLGTIVAATYKMGKT